MSLREALEGEMTRQESAAPPAEAPAVTSVTPPVNVPTGEPATPIGSAPRARDESGKFKAADKTDTRTPESAPKGVEKAGQVAAAASGEAKAGGEPTPPPPGTPPAEAKKPPRVPQSWKPEARELAQKLPAEFHPLLEESVRVDEHVRRALNESAQARQFKAQVDEQLAPFAPIAKANNMDTLAYAGSVLQAAAQLQMGTQQQKDSLLAGLIAQYGGSVDGINAYLQGQAAPPAQAQRAPDIRTEFKKMWEEQVGQVKEQAATTKVQAFLKTEPEFIRDVWPAMAAILQASEEQGRALPIEDAYDRACYADPEIRKVLSQREAAKAATATNAATQQAVNAASGIRSTPSSAPTAKPKDLRSALEAELDRQGVH